MELRDLKYFLACLDAGSLTLAARRVHTAQPTLSHAITRLERELGERLLVRAPNTPVSATDAGTLLARHARDTLACLARFREALSDLRGGLSGSVRVAAIPSASSTLLPRALRALAASHPAIEISVRTLSAEKIAGAVASGREQLGVVSGGAHQAGADLEERALCRERFVAVMRRDDTLARRRVVRVRQLAGRAVLLSPAGSATSRLVLAACREVGVTPSTPVTLGSAEALRETARQGLGVAILPQGLVAARDADLVERPLVDPEVERELWLIQRRATTHSRAVGAVANAIAAAAAARR